MTFRRLENSGFQRRNRTRIPGREVVVERIFTANLQALGRQGGWADESREKLDRGLRSVWDSVFVMRKSMPKLVHGSHEALLVSDTYLDDFLQPCSWMRGMSSSQDLVSHGCVRELLVD